jgi:HPt (histidine-containing phosphotransfer) domain-containing protein
MPTPIIDLERGIAACADSAELHAQVSRLLASDIMTRVHAVEAALKNGDLVEASKQAHKHKGACLAVGAQALAEAFSAIDSAARAGDRSGATVRASALTEMAQSFRSAVENLA